MMGRCDDDSPLARFDVRTRVIVTLAAMLAVVMSSRPWLPLAVFAVCAGYWIVARESLRFALGRLAGPLGLAGLVWLWRALTTGGTPVCSLDLGPWRLIATREGLLGGALIASRVLGSVSVFIILCNTTPAHRLESVLRWARMPRTWLEIAMLMHRYIFILLEQALSVVSAQKLRLGYGSLRRARRRCRTWRASSCCDPWTRPRSRTRRWSPAAIRARCLSLPCRRCPAESGESPRRAWRWWPSSICWPRGGSRESWRDWRSD